MFLDTDMRSISFDRGHANKMGGIILVQICKHKEQYASHIEKSERTCKFPLEPWKVNLIKAVYLYKFMFDTEVFNEKWPAIKK